MVDLLVRERGARATRPGLRTPVALLGWGGSMVVAAAFGGLAVVAPQLGILAIGAVALVALLLRPGVAALLAVALLPLPVSVVPGFPLEVSASDLLVVVALAGWLVRDLLVPERDAAPSVVRPMVVGLGAYGLAAGLSLVWHPSATGLVTGFQRTLLVLGALAVGARLVREGLIRPALAAYLVVATVLAVFAILDTGSGSFLGVQKNPAGGYIAAGAFIAVVLRPYRWWWVAGGLCAMGLVATQSRGALIGAAAAAGTTVLLARYRERARALGGVAVAGALLIVSYFLLPQSARARLRNTSADDDFAISSREDFHADALDTFREHRWTGVGMGNYQGGMRLPLGPGTDPHQVFYFQLAEGGAPLLVGFALLLLGSLVVSFRLLGRTRLAVVAFAVQVSTIVHVYFDVYWVRGTPVPAYLLLGAAIAAAAYQARADPRGDLWSVSVRSGRRRPDSPAVAVAGASATTGADAARGARA